MKRRRVIRFSRFNGENDSPPGKWKPKNLQKTALDITSYIWAFTRARILIVFLLCFIIAPASYAPSSKDLTEKGMNTQSDEDSESSNDGYLHSLKVKAINYIIKSNLPRKINFDKMNINVLSGTGADIYNLKIAENSDFGKQDFFISRFVHMKVDFLPLLIGNINISKMIVERPTIRLIRNAKGEYSFNDLMKGIRGKKAILDWMEISNLSLRDGKIYIIDELPLNGPLILKMDSYNLELYDFASDKMCRIKIESRLPGGEKKNLRMTGNVGPLNKDLDIQQIPINFGMTIDNISLSHYTKFIPQGLPSYPVSGIISMDFNFNGAIASGITTCGEMLFRDLVMESGFNKSHTDKLSMLIRLNEKTLYKPEAGVAEFESLEILFNKNKFIMKGRVEDLRIKPHWDVSINSKELSLTDLMKFAPYVKGFLPQDLTFTGAMDMKALSWGNIDDLKVVVDMRMKDMGIAFGNIMRKEKSVPGFMFIQSHINKNKLSVNGEFKYDQLEIQKAHAVKVFDDFMNQLSDIKKMIKFRKKMKKVWTNYKKRFQKNNADVYKHIKCAFSMSGKDFSVSEISIANMQMTAADGSHLIQKGAIDLKTNDLNLQGNIYLTSELSKKLIQAAPPIKALLYRDGRLMIPFMVKGSFKDIKVAFDVKHVKKALQSKTL